MYLDPKKQPLPNEADTETHRLMRRGIPFGDPFDPTVLPDDGNRGLLFLAYQTSIEDQFEFVIKNWVNNPDFKDPGSGHDPILGQSDKTGDRERFFSVKLANGEKQRIQPGKRLGDSNGRGLLFLALYPCIGGFERLRRLENNDDIRWGNARLRFAIRLAHVAPRSASSMNLGHRYSRLPMREGGVRPVHTRR